MKFPFRTAVSAIPLLPMVLCSAAFAQTPREDEAADRIVVTARRIQEDAQSVPIPLSVVAGAQLERTGTYNVARLTQLQPTLQFYSSNPRNTAINIRGLGAPFGLTNDGIEPGVGVYIDQVYHPRPATGTFDFNDIAQIEILRGPQGTLYGKNTTAGAINVTTRAPTFEPEALVETSFGNYGFVQAKAALSGPLAGDVLVGRVSFTGTQRNGTVRNILTDTRVNDLDNIGVRGQLLYQPSDRLKVTFAGDFNRQDAECCTQVVAGVAPTLRAPNRQFAQMAADLGYAPPSLDPFDRLTDIDSKLQAVQNLGGASILAEWKIGGGTLTSVSAWRFWDWDPASDRDFLGLPITTISANPSKQRQYTQELRYASKGGESVDYVVGLFAYRQTIDSTGLQEQGPAAARWLLAPAPGDTPDLLDGLRAESGIGFSNTSLAAFGQATWNVSDRFRLLPGVRFNWDKKNADYNQVVSGGLDTDDPALIARKNSVLASQSYAAAFEDFNVSGQITASWDAADHISLFATYARSFKSGGVNLGGIPNDANGNPAVALASIEPEDERHYEAGVKSRFFGRALTVNLSAFQTDIHDYQAQVVNASVGVLRGYLANADKVRVRGLEAEGDAKIGERLSLYVSAALTEGEYVSFPDAPCPLELTGGPSQVCDISGTELPGLSRWSASFGGEYAIPARLFGAPGDAYLGADASYRSSFSSSATSSAYLQVEGYALANFRAGFRSDGGWEIFAWVRNAFDQDYFEFLSAQPGGSGLYVGQLGDPRTYGVTLKARL